MFQAGLITKGLKWCWCRRNIQSERYQNQIQVILWSSYHSFLLSLEFISLPLVIVFATTTSIICKWNGVVWREPVMVLCLLLVMNIIWLKTNNWAQKLVKICNNLEAKMMTTMVANKSPISLAYRFLYIFHNLGIYLAT